MMDETFDRLFLDYQPRLLAYARHFVGEDYLGEDIVQEVFLHFWDKYADRAKEEAPRILFTMVRNRCIDHLKRKRVLSRNLLSLFDELRGDERLYQLDFLGFADEKERVSVLVNRQVEAVLASLPPRCREVFTLSRIDGLTNREIADRLGISRTAVEKHIRRALSAFAEDLRAHPSLYYEMRVLSLFFF